MSDENKHPAEQETFRKALQLICHFLCNYFWNIYVGIHIPMEHVSQYFEELRKLTES